MSNRRKPAWERSDRRRRLACGCSALVVRACDGVCRSCGCAESITFPPMPSSQHVGDVSEIGWACKCGAEIRGRGVVVEVREL